MVCLVLMLVLKMDLVVHNKEVLVIKILVDSKVVLDLALVVVWAVLAVLEDMVTTSCPLPAALVVNLI